jgi:hypothetical protein
MSNFSAISWREPVTLEASTLTITSPMRFWLEVMSKWTHDQLMKTLLVNFNSVLSHIFNYYIANVNLADWLIFHLRRFTSNCVLSDVIGVTHWPQIGFCEILQDHIITPDFIQIVVGYIFNPGRHGRDRRVVGFTTTYAISAYHQSPLTLWFWIL